MFGVSAVSSLAVVGRLGLGENVGASLNIPAKVTSLPTDCTPVDVVCGFNSSVILTTEGRIFCTGSNR